MFCGHYFIFIDTGNRLLYSIDYKKIMSYPYLFSKGL